MLGNGLGAGGLVGWWVGDVLVEILAWTGRKRGDFCIGLGKRHLL